MRPKIVSSLIYHLCSLYLIYRRPLPGVCCYLRIPFRLRSRDDATIDYLRALLVRLKYHQRGSLKRPKNLPVRLWSALRRQVVVTILTIPIAWSCRPFRSSRRHVCQHRFGGPRVCSRDRVCALHVTETAARVVSTPRRAFDSNRCSWSGKP